MGFKQNPDLGMSNREPYWPHILWQVDNLPNQKVHCLLILRWVRVCVCVCVLRKIMFRIFFSTPLHLPYRLERYSNMDLINLTACVCKATLPLTSGTILDNLCVPSPCSFVWKMEIQQYISHVVVEMQCWVNASVNVNADIFLPKVIFEKLEENGLRSANQMISKKNVKIRWTDNKPGILE